MEVSPVSLDHVTLGNSYESRYSNGTSTQSTTEVRTCDLNGTSPKSLSLDPVGYRDKELVIIFRSREQSEL